MLEEMYAYFNMPAPAFGIQHAYNQTEYPERISPVVFPGHPICFLWAMAAHRGGEVRQFGVVNVQRGFDQGSSGLEAGRKK